MKQLLEQKIEAIKKEMHADITRQLKAQPRVHGNAAPASTGPAPPVVRPSPAQPNPHAQHAEQKPKKHNPKHTPAGPANAAPSTAPAKPVPDNQSKVDKKDKTALDKTSKELQNYSNMDKETKELWRGMRVMNQADLIRNMLTVAISDPTRSAIL